MAASLALLPSASAQIAPSTRAASLNLCTDELLLMLARPEQIVSLSYLSQSPSESPFWQRARRYHRNDGSLLSVAPLRPDLVVTMGNGGDRAGIAQGLGIAMLTLPYAQSIADVEANITRVAAALGRQSYGRRLIKEIETLRRRRPLAAIDTIWLGGGGRSTAPDSLAAEWMRLAGLRQRELAGNRLSLEQLLTRPPQLLLRSNYRSRQYSAEQRWLSHPIVKRARRSRTLLTDGRRWTCLGPAMIREVKRLRKALDE